MALRGSGALRLEGALPSQQTPSSDDTLLVAHEGGGLDARMREGVSSTLTRTAAAIVATVLVFFALGSASVAMTAGTVAILSDNADITSEIQTLRAANSDLRIERSLLARADRVSRIATQNLGMVYAAEAEHLELK